MGWLGSANELYETWTLKPMSVVLSFGQCLDGLWLIAGGLERGFELEHGQANYDASFFVSLNFII